MNIELIRYGNTEKGVFGEIVIGGNKYKTVERPYLDNLPNISSVPAGVYKLEPHESERWGSTWALVNKSLGVHHWPGEGVKRFAILLHVANRPHELAGCIGLGKFLGAIGGEFAVTSSGPAVHEALGILSKDTVHTLTIRWADGFSPEG